jgi:hypothetical protein
MATPPAIVRTTSFAEQAPLRRDPDQHRRLCILHHVEQGDFVGRGTLPMADGSARLHERLLEVEALHALDQEPVAIDGVEARPRLFLLQTRLDHLAQEQRRDAAAGGARPYHDDALLGQGNARDIDGGEQRAGGDGGGALNIVVES